MRCKNGEKTQHPEACQDSGRDASRRVAAIRGGVAPIHGIGGKEENKGVQNHTKAILNHLKANSTPSEAPKAFSYLLWRTSWRL